MKSRFTSSVKKESLHMESRFTSSEKLIRFVKSKNAKELLCPLNNFNNCKGHNCMFWIFKNTQENIKAEEYEFPQLLGTCNYLL